MRKILVFNRLDVYKRQMADDDGYATSNVYVQGPLFGADAKIGKFDSWGAQGYVLDDAMRGMELNYTSDKLDTTVRFGRVNGGHDLSLIHI